MERLKGVCVYAAFSRYKNKSFVIFYWRMTDRDFELKATSGDPSIKKYNNSVILATPIPDHHHKASTLQLQTPYEFLG